MIDACDRNGVQLMTAYRLHFERCNLEVADIVRKKRIGDARYFDSQFSMQVKAGNIRLNRDLGGGPVWDIGIYCHQCRALRVRRRADAGVGHRDELGDPRFTEVAETVHVIMKFPETASPTSSAASAPPIARATKSSAPRAASSGSGLRIRRRARLRIDDRRKEEEARNSPRATSSRPSWCTSRNACAPAQARALRQGRPDRRHDHRSHSSISSGPGCRRRLRANAAGRRCGRKCVARPCRANPHW